jgi:hypothetical protein
MPGSLGCTIFVKLWQFDPDDRTHVRVDTTGMTYGCAPGRAGVGLIPLFHDARESVRQESWAPDAEIVLPAPGGLELLVLQGGFTEAGEGFEPQSWLRLPVAATFRARTGASGCRVWVKTGHLSVGKLHRRRLNPILTPEAATSRHHAPFRTGFRRSHRGRQRTL